MWLLGQTLAQMRNQNSVRTQFLCIFLEDEDVKKRNILSWVSLQVWNWMESHCGIYQMDEDDANDAHCNINGKKNNRKVISSWNKGEHIWFPANSYDFQFINRSEHRRRMRFIVFAWFSTDLADTRCIGAHRTVWISFFCLIFFWLRSGTNSTAYAPTRRCVWCLHFLFVRCFILIHIVSEDAITCVGIFSIWKAKIYISNKIIK